MLYGHNYVLHWNKIGDSTVSSRFGSMHLMLDGHNHMSNLNPNPLPVDGGDGFHLPRITSEDTVDEQWLSEHKSLIRSFLALYHSQL